MALLRPTNDLVLATQFPELSFPNGAEQVVPGMTVMFTFFWGRSIGESFLFEHGWQTWERLQMSFASPAQIMLGKAIPFFCLIAIQHMILFVGGGAIFGLEWNGAIGGMILILLALNICVLMFGLMLATMMRTLAQVEAADTLATLMFASFGGSFVPVTSLPGVAEDIAPATPNYWALEAARDVILEGEGLDAVLVPTLAILGFAALFGAIVMAKFSFDVQKDAHG